MSRAQILRLGLFALVCLLLAWLYRTFEPTAVGFYPECPIYAVSGYKCPGCGTQRAAHELLHFNLPGAFRQNPLFVLVVPYALLAVGLEVVKPERGRWLRVYETMLSTPALLIALATMIGYAVARNTL